VLKGVRELLAGGAEITYARGCGIQEDELEAFGPESLTDGKGNRGLLGEYFNGPDLTGEPAFSRLDDRIGFDWAITMPDGRITSHCFCVRWTGTVKTAGSFTGRIGISSRDSMRLWVDGDLLADGWGREKSASVSVPFRFEQGREYRIRLEYCRDADGAEVLFGFGDAARETEEAVRAASDADAVIVALGDSERTCGEGVDRSELGLPGRQEELLRTVYAAGTPVVLVLQNGRPVTLEWESEHIPAILEAWYPGEQGGRAIAEAIFGVFSPAGRLPVSFPKSVGQIPVYYSRRRGGAASYIDRDNRPRYPFGHGLSYTEFSYENLRISPERIAPDGSARVTFDVVNTGERAGDEVAQIYVSDRVSSVVQPEKLLKRFFRFHLEPGERKTVAAELGFEELKLLDASFRWTVEKGEFRILVGSSSEDIRLTGNLSVV
jgi:beta-glucosidase